MSDLTTAQLAGVSALVAAVATVVGMVTLLMFFSRGDPWGKVNDAASVVLMLAMIPVQALLVAGRVTYEQTRLAVLGLGAVVGLWYVLTAIVSGATDLPDGLRLLAAVAGLGFIAVGYGFARGGARHPAASIGGLALFVSSVAFQLWLGALLVSRALVVPERNL
ncbi:hypothetical protein BH20CHL7_BH20CHL7_10670 [soil metagenome]